MLKKLRRIFIISIVVHIIGIIGAFIAIMLILSKAGVINLDDIGLTSSMNQSNKPITASVQGILNACEMIAKYMDEHDFYYSRSGSELGYTYDSGTRGCCCATYVSWALQETGLISTHTDYSGSWDGILGNDPNWERFVASDDSDLQPGDVNVFGTRHTNIYAGDGKCWDAGNGSNGAFLGTTKDYSVTGDGRYTHSYRYKK